MIRFTVLGSSSSGNASLLECGQTRILIDAGFSAKRLREKLALLGLDAEDLNAILVTHEHIDHVRGIRVLTKNLSIPVYATLGTADGADPSRECPRWNIFEPNQSFMIQDVRITPFPIPHDACEPVGFRIEYAGIGYGHLSDAGHVTDTIRKALAGVNLLFLEANYDPDLLADDLKRSYSTKQRIASHHGHLSNEQASSFLEDIGHEDLHHIVLAHLSKDCNRPHIAAGTARERLHHLPESVCLHCAHPDELLETIILSLHE